MNPFVSHHILKDLPYDLMTQPDKEGIEQFVEKKRGRFFLFSAITLISGVMLLVFNLMLLKPELGPILNFINLWFWFVMSAILFKRAKSIHLEEGELEELLKNFSKEVERNSNNGLELTHTQWSA